jgi:hypothetical protein
MKNTMGATMKKTLSVTLAALAGAAVARDLYLAFAIVTTCGLAKVRSHETDQFAVNRAQRLASTHTQSAAAKR